MISIVCVYNNRDILDNYLLKSLKNQSSEYELILMDNTKGKFKSAAEALNKGGKKAKGNYIAFIHQDIDLKSPCWIETTEKILNSLENLGIAGVAGRIKHQGGILTNIEHGIPPQKNSNHSIKAPVKVQTLDECLLIIPKLVFDNLKFDEKTCDDWHLYGTDYALTVKKMGFNVYVIPTNLYHRSPGFSYSKNFDLTLKEVLRKHWRELGIYTTMGDWITFYPIDTQEKYPKLKKTTIDILNRLTQFMK